MALPPLVGRLGCSTGTCPPFDCPLKNCPPKVSGDGWFNDGGSDAHGQFAMSALPSTWALDPTWTAPPPTFMLGGQLGIFGVGRVPCLIAIHGQTQKIGTFEGLACWDAIHMITTGSSLSTDPESSNYSVLTLPQIVQPGIYLLVGTEFIQVTDMEPTTMVATVARAQLGSTLAAHSSGIASNIAFWARSFPNELTFTNPTYSQFAITQGLSSAQIAIWLDTDEGTDENGNHLGTLTYLDAGTGITLWSATERNAGNYCFTAIPGKPAATTVYYASYDSGSPYTITARNTSNGTVKWGPITIPAPSAGSGAGTGTIGFAFVGATTYQDGDLQNLNPLSLTTGLPTETTNGVIALLMNNPNADANRSSITYLRGIKTADGTTAWTTALNRDFGDVEVQCQAGGAFGAPWAVMPRILNGSTATSLAVIGVATYSVNTTPDPYSGMAGTAGAVEVVAVDIAGNIAWRNELWYADNAGGPVAVIGSMAVTSADAAGLSGDASNWYYFDPGVGDVLVPPPSAGDVLPIVGDIPQPGGVPRILAVPASNWLLVAPGRQIGIDADNPVFWAGNGILYADLNPDQNSEYAAVLGDTGQFFMWNVLVPGVVLAELSAIDAQGNNLWDLAGDSSFIENTPLAGSGTPSTPTGNGLAAFISGASTGPEVTPIEVFGSTSSTPVQTATVEGARLFGTQVGILFAGAIYALFGSGVVRIGTPAPPS